MLRIGSWGGCGVLLWLRGAGHSKPAAPLGRSVSGLLRILCKLKKKKKNQNSENGLFLSDNPGLQTIPSRV